MNKSEFISAVAEKSGLSKVDAKKAVEAFVDTVSNELKEGGWLRFILCVREGRS